MALIYPGEIGGAAGLFEQLYKWQQRGYEVQLLSSSDGKWYCAVSSPGWIIRNRHPNDEASDEALRYVTAPKATPVAAICAAMEVLK